MPFFELLMKAVYLFFGLVGLGLFVAGAWGSIRLPRQEVGAPLTVQQRVLCTMLGLLLMGASWVMFPGLPPQQ